LNAVSHSTYTLLIGYCRSMIFKELVVCWCMIHNVSSDFQ
jgi:hypothetical protein